MFPKRNIFQTFIFSMIHSITRQNLSVLFTWHKKICIKGFHFIGISKISSWHFIIKPTFKKSIMNHNFERQTDQNVVAFFNLNLKCFLLEIQTRIIQKYFRFSAFHILFEAQIKIHYLSLLLLCKVEFQLTRLKKKQLWRFPFQEISNFMDGRTCPDTKHKNDRS